MTSITNNPLPQTVDGLAYMANYGSGLRVVDVSGVELDPTGGNFVETGFFDCHPEDDDINGEVAFLGTWSVYPYFKSGYILLNSIERGVFSLKYNGPKAKYGKKKGPGGPKGGPKHEHD